MRYALVKDGIVKNVIIAEQEFIDSLTEYDSKVQLDASLAVEMGYSYDGSVFTAPETSVDIQDIIKKAEKFGQELMRKFSAENVAMGITQAGKTNSVRKALVQVISALQTGSLYDAIYELKAIPEESKDATFLTDSRLLIVVNAIEDYLGRPRSSSL